MSRLGQFYAHAYTALAGSHPRPRPWHFQWLVSRNLQRALDMALPQLQGRVLDIGCGTKPYTQGLSTKPGVQVIGIDILPAPQVDVLVAAQGPWPFSDNAIDSVLCTETLEHVVDLHRTLANIQRVMKPGGCLVITVPFLYNVHGQPHDFRRLTCEGLSAVLADGFEIAQISPLGGIGSVTSVLTLNWIDVSCNLSYIGRIVKGLLLPVWLGVALVINLLGLLLDKLDHTAQFYSHVVLVARAN